MMRAAGSDHLAHSFTDLMISLMVIFVFLLVVFLNNQASVSTAVTQSLLADMKRQLCIDQFLRDKGLVRTFHSPGPETDDGADTDVRPITALSPDGPNLVSRHE